ncbi:MAG: NTP transferase domain-containing protein [Armatimonadetes bacterium]|nr:NTP transferase domain-containing protein [Armatimonadota bacterium]
MAQALKKIRKAVIPVAGKGTRLLPLTKVIAKEMLPLGRKPVLEIVVDELVSTGITDVMFVISESKSSIPVYFMAYPGVDVSWTVQSEQKGLADAVLCAEEYVAGEPFLVALGDSVISQFGPRHPTSRVLDCFENTDAQSVIIVQKTPRAESHRYGMVHPKRWDGNERFEIDLLVEKPAVEDAPSEYAIAGRYAFDPCVFEFIRKTPPGAGGELQITDSIGLMLADGRPVWGVPLMGEEIRRDIGTFPSYFEAFMAACLSDPEFAAIASTICSREQKPE